MEKKPKDSILLLGSEIMKMKIKINDKFHYNSVKQEIYNIYKRTKEETKK